MPAFIRAIVVALCALAADVHGAGGSDRLLLDFDHRSDGIAAEIQPDIPRLRVFESGRVLVYYPVYMKRAGLWEGWLNPTELGKLLDALQARGVFTLDERMLARRAADARKSTASRTGSHVHRSEVVTSVFRSPGRGNHRLVVRNLQNDARELPVPELKSLAEAERMLLRLAQSNRLVRIEEASAVEAHR